MDIFANQAEVLIRNMIAICILFIFTLLIGKRLISELNFFDFIVGITIGSIAASLSVEERVSISDGIVTLIIWGLVPIIIAKLSLASHAARKLFDGTPVIVIQEGKILEDNLRKQNYNINELLEELRLGGVYNIADVESAILETNGRISIQLKAEKQPATPSDLNIAVTRQGLSANVIMDGRILNEQLRLLNRDADWLNEEIRKRNIESVDQILFASVDTSGTLFIDLKEDKLETTDILKTSK